MLVPISAKSKPRSERLQVEFIEIAGNRLCYTRAGPANKTVLFIHGNSSCKEAFTAQFRPLLDAGYGLLAVDLPGHGMSGDATEPGRQYTISGYADTLSQLVSALGLDRPLLCGWSLGGHIAMQMAGESDAYAGLAIIGAPPIAPGLKHLDSAFLPGDAADVTGEESPSMERLGAYLNDVYGTLSPPPSGLIAAGRRTDGKCRSVMMLDWAQGLAGHDQTRVISEWRRPLLIVHGAADKFISESYMRSFSGAGQALHSRLIVLDEIGHAPFLEAPAAFNTVLIEFCDGAFNDPT